MFYNLVDPFDIIDYFLGIIFWISRKRTRFCKFFSFLFANPSQLALSVFQKIKKIIPFSQVFISIVSPYLKQLKYPAKLRYFFNKITSVHSKSPDILGRHSPRVLITSDLSARPVSGIQRSCNKISKIKIWSIIKFNLRRIANSPQWCVCVLIV